MSDYTVDNSNDKPKPKPVNKAVVLLTTLIFIMAFVLAGLGWVYYTQKQEAEAVQTHLNAEKDSLTADLQEIMFEYDELETDNEAMRLRLEEEQQRAEQLYNELSRVRSVSYGKIREYQRELGTLRAIMKDMVYEIDSLNTLNQQLIAENIQVRREYTQSQRTVENLEQRTEQLSSAVSLGSVIRARSIVTTGLSRRDRETTRARRVEKFQTCFTLSQNSIAQPGLRTVYMRMYGPDGYVLAKSNTNLFEFEGERIIFSESREIDYQNDDVDMCIFLSADGEVSDGTYRVELYMDGHIIGESAFTLR